MITIIISLLLFGLLIGIHEFGHLIAAKLNKINVIEFSIGMGPKIFSYNKNGTLYSLRLLPIGGYCNMEGENEDVDSPDSFSSKSPLRKISVLIAGAFMNLLLGYIVLFFITLSMPEVPSNIVGKVNTSSYAYTQGLKEDDKIIMINNKPMSTFDSIYYFMADNKDEDITLTVIRNGKKENLNITPYYNEGSYYIGFSPKYLKNNMYISLKEAFHSEILISKLILKSLSQLFIGDLSLNEASGPIGVVKEIGSAAKNGVNNVLYILAIITINLGLFNLLPIPALDGGRVFFSFIELITRKKIPIKVEATIHALGLSLLLFVMLFVTINDVVKLFS